MNFALADNKKFIRKLTEIVQQNLSNENFRVDELVKESGLSSSIIRRRLKEISRKSINQFINEVRLQQALELLKQGNDTASEVSYKTGFSSPAYFTKSFHNYYGYPPGDVKRKATTGQEKIVPLSGSPEISKQTSAGGSKEGKKSEVPLVIRVAAVIFAIVLVSWLGYQLFDGKSKSTASGAIRKSEKSIAVLPFINDSPDSTNVYFINGIMKAILENLSTIQDLRVVSRNSVEQYRNNKKKSTRQIARELSVDYIVEGSGQKYSDQIKLSVQLIEARTDKHLLSEHYESRLEDIFNLESDVALKVASRIKAVVTPEEKELIETPPTTNLTAMIAYEQGRQLYDATQIMANSNLLRQAEIFCRKAIGLDPAYTDPVVLLGKIQLLYGNEDSALLQAGKALRINPKCAEAYLLKGNINLWS